MGDEVPKRVKRSFSAAIPRSGFAGAIGCFRQVHMVYRQPASSASSAERADLISRAIIPTSFNAESKTEVASLHASNLPDNCISPTSTLLSVYLQRNFMERDLYAFGHDANPCSIPSGKYLLI
ncbi:MAG: hypothetical protein ACLR17_04840 [Enterobacteriaceae bacterium]